MYIIREMAIIEVEKIDKCIVGSATAIKEDQNNNERRQIQLMKYFKCQTLNLLNMWHPKTLQATLPC